MCGLRQDVVELEVGRVLQRLLAEDVERGAGDVAGLDGFGEGFVDDELAARAVHDADARLHDGERVLVDEAFGLRREADVQREEVGVGEDFVDGDEGDAVLARDDGSDEGVVAEEVHAEGLGAAGDFEADAAEPTMPSVLPRSSEPCSDFLSHLPACMAALARGMVRAHRDHEAEGEFGDGDGVGAGGVHHDDAAAGGFGGVDVVDADAGAADDAELRARRPAARRRPGRRSGR